MENPEWLVQLCEEVFSPDQFIEDMYERGEINQLLHEAPYHELVYRLCHTSCAYMVLRLQQWVSYGMEDIPTDKFWWCHGTVNGCDHSWVEFREDDQIIVVDLTIAQSYPDMDMLYIGKRLPFYGPSTDACFSDKETIMFFAKDKCG